MAIPTEQEQLLQLRIELERFEELTGREEEVAITKREIAAVQSLIKLAGNLSRDLEQIVAGHVAILKHIRHTSKP